MSILSHELSLETAEEVTGGHTVDHKAARVRAYIRKTITNRMPGAAVIVIKAGRVLLKEGFGTSQLKPFTECGPDTIYDLASVSKQFTAMAILLLRDRGRGTVNGLRYYKPISTYLSPKYELPEWLGRITVGQLLNHTSGIPDYYDIFEQSKPEDLSLVFRQRAASNVKIESLSPRSATADRTYGIIEPTSQQVLELLRRLEANKEKKIPRFEPREHWEYSNVAYMMLAQIVEQISGQKFADFMKENIFQPLGMDSTFIYCKTPENQDTVIPKRATSYDRGWYKYHDIDYTPLNYIYGDGNVNSNLEDMYKWDQALEIMLRPEFHHGKTPLISARTVREVFKSRWAQQPTSKTQNINYNFGWFVGNACGLRLMWHQGSWVGFKTMIMRFSHEKQRLTIIILSNNKHLKLNALASRIAVTFLGNEMKIPVPVAMSVDELREIVKEHRQKLWESSFEDLTLEGNSLWVKTPDREKYELVPVRKNFFYVKGYEGFDNFSYYFGPDPLTPQGGLRAVQNKRTLLLRRT